MKPRKKKRRPPNPKKVEVNPRTPSSWTRRDKIIVAAAILAAGIIFGGAPVLESYVEAKQRLGERLAKWQTSNHLSNDQVEKLREIEVTYHGASAFSLSRNHSHEESEAHHHLIERYLRSGSPPVLADAGLDADGDD